ncbi:uncharacterized protein LOC119999245 isoform X2 [Tripterygium wilfordii]|uniref:uncharacterized protein LOC119999245 isoform X2 n=1 Tax=Tripterygium wilfordii TaxID=458696 RepID=UPI0018F8206F|nr:uncharacterized protein LOC119999245 isoform X2 [Tripterygium wilfordii]
MAEIEDGSPSNSHSLTIDELLEDNYPFTAFRRGELISQLIKARYNLLNQKNELSNLKQKQAAVVGEAESIMASLSSRMNFLALGNSFMVIAAKSTISCISLLSSITITVILLGTLVFPVFLTFIRMRELYLDFTELAREQLKMIELLEKPYNLVELIYLSGSPVRLSLLVESHFNEVNGMIKRVKSMNGSLYRSLYNGCFRSVSISLMVYVGTVFWMANWESCETSTPPASSPGLGRIRSALVSSY